MDILRENIGLLQTFTLCEGCIEAYAVTGDEEYLSILEQGLSDEFIIKKLGFKDKAEADAFHQQIGDRLNRGQIVSDKDARKYNLMIRHTVMHHSDAYNHGDIEYDPKYVDDYIYSKGNLDQLRERRIVNKKNLRLAGERGFKRGLAAGSLGIAAGAGAIGAGIYAYQQYKNRPKSVIAQRIAALRGIYKKFMLNAQKNPNKANVFKRIAAKILSVIDKLMGYIQNATN